MQGRARLGREVDVKNNTVLEEELDRVAQVLWGERVESGMSMSAINSCVALNKSDLHRFGPIHRRGPTPTRE